MIVLGICPTCGESRVRSTRELSPGDRLDPADFEPIGDTPPPEFDAPMVCFTCTAPLVFRRDPASPPPVPIRSEATPAPALTTANGHADHAVATTELFAAGQGEDVVQMRELSPTRYLIQTTRRLILVDLTAVLPGGSDA